MASIAKFVTSNGGVAFSDKVMKIQTRGEEAVYIPLHDIATVRIRHPREDNEGFIRVDIVDGRRYRIFFDDDDDLQKAAYFKEAFDNTISDQEFDLYDSDQSSEPADQQFTFLPGPRVNDYGRTVKRQTINPKIIAVIVIIAIAAVCALVLPKRAQSGTKKAPPVLVGSWTQTDGNSSDSYQFATISNDAIEIYWYFDEGQTTALYWAGSFTAPTTTAEPYTWDSVNDKQKTNTSILASGEDTKTFTYENGIISYTASMAGVTTTVKLKKAADGTLPDVGGSSSEAQTSGGQKDFDGSSYSDLGKGTFSLVNESGSTVGGNIIVVYADADTMLLQLGYKTEGIYGGALSYFYIDGKLSRTDKVSDSQGSLDLQGDFLTVGTHTVELVQYFYDSPNNAVNVYKSASYEVRGK